MCLLEILLLTDIKSINRGALKEDRRGLDMAAKKNIILRNQSGVALVIALIMVVVITLIALASSYTSIFEIKMSGNKRGSTDAFYVADAGINAIMSSTASFNTSVYTVLVPNTLGYDPFTNPNIPNPTNIPRVNLPLTPSNAPIINYQTQAGPPRGTGFSAVSVNYAYFQVRCVGNDSAGTGATTTIQQDVMELIPAQQ